MEKLKQLKNVTILNEDFKYYYETEQQALDYDIAQKKIRAEIVNYRKYINAHDFTNPTNLDSQALKLVAFKFVLLEIKHEREKQDKLIKIEELEDKLDQAHISYQQLQEENQQLKQQLNKLYDQLNESQQVFSDLEKIIS